MSDSHNASSIDADDRSSPDILRAMTPADVSSSGRRPRAGRRHRLSAVFPQEQYPFPRHDVAQRWLQEIVTTDIACFVVLEGGVIAGFAAVRGEALLHFGTAWERWGTGLAQRAHDELLDQMRSRGVQSAWLRVFTDNGRGRRLYEKLGWQATAERTRSSFPPFPELVRYERVL